MASKRKVTKRKGPSDAVVRKISVPQGTREIVIHVTIGRRAKKAFKLMKSEIDDDPRGGTG